MKFNKVNAVLFTLFCATLSNSFGNSQAEAANIQLIGLTDNNSLVLFYPNNSSNTQTVGITGISGNLVGIDVRPADKKLYGVTDSNSIYTIDPSTGIAQLVMNPPTVPFTLNGTSFGVDFNPVPDRIRVVSDADQNLRLNPITGGIALNPNTTPAIDVPLSYASGDPNAGADPNIVAAAYTNNFAGTTTTTLFNIDSNLDILVRQGGFNVPPGTPSPNDGQLFTIGALGIDFGSQGGFDIFSNGQDMAFAASGSSLYSIDLTTGAATTLGTIGGSPNIVGLAARAVPEPGMVGSLMGFSVFAVFSRFFRRNISH
ncbi:PEP-CTERM sorting domain-containing protein [Aphanothece hegewaldii CCALA 016]|uniref:PEP-CTERM sorting domain-containing protein n=1 Tax=Aphanothece hegewaldii CCALA 016 TaxID=2107694 RepID=A0A2T1LY89_9CHRO|nr:DUF4394 domain-containing protein [Aphanothece hegewaldii]PSF37355.1 PEP-CTERM sorting domain-containing protein [Aphanothece hegewaldii CCALA 016]